jgi:peptidyl-prolyl cis-trans isomerase D
MKNLFVILIGSILALSCQPSTKECGVKASHILTMADTPEEFKAAHDTAEVIIAKLKNGESFEDLAAQYGSDGTKDKGGQLGWFGRSTMVQPFEDSCFNATINRPLIVETQFGVHVVNVTEKNPSCK